MLEADNEEESQTAGGTGAVAGCQQHRDNKAGQPDQAHLPVLVHQGEQRQASGTEGIQGTAREHPLIGEEGPEIRPELPEPAKQEQSVDDSEQRERSQIYLTDPEISQALELRLAGFRAEASVRRARRVNEPNRSPVMVRSRRCGRPVAVSAGSHGPLLDIDLSMRSHGVLLESGWRSIVARRRLTRVPLPVAT